jgi:hypothetical protein
MIVIYIDQELNNDKNGSVPTLTKHCLFSMPVRSRLRVGIGVDD